MPEPVDNQRIDPKSPWWPLFVVALGVTSALLLIRWVVLAPVQMRSGTTVNASESENPLSWVFAGGGTTAATADEAPVRWEPLVTRARDAAAKGAEETRAFVSALYAALDERMPVERRALVAAFFESGVDAPLDLGFAVGPGGFLCGWPSLRAALFDYLALRDADAARSLAERLLADRPELPAEWAIALRELARGKAAKDWPEIVWTRVYDLIDDPEWSETCPPGWPEALDVIAAGGAFQLLPDLSRLAAKSRPRAVQFAAFLAAERLMQADPGRMLETLNRDTRLFAESTGTRAGFFARADVRRPDQLRALEVYLMRPDVLPGERMHFGALFPHPGGSANPGLLTAAADRPEADRLSRDQASLEQIEHWREETRFGERHRWLGDVHERLRGRLAGGASDGQLLRTADVGPPR